MSFLAAIPLEAAYHRARSSVHSGKTFNENYGTPWGFRNVQPLYVLRSNVNIPVDVLKRPFNERDFPYVTNDRFASKVWIDDGVGDAGSHLRSRMAPSSNVPIVWGCTPSAFRPSAASSRSTCTGLAMAQKSPAEPGVPNMHFGHDHHHTDLACLFRFKLQACDAVRYQHRTRVTTSFQSAPALT